MEDEFIKIGLGLLEEEWKQIGKIKEYPDAFESDYQKKQMYEETKEFVGNFSAMTAVHINGLNLKSRAKIKDDWYKENIRKHCIPNEREIFLESKDKKFRGYVDKITKDFEGNSIIYDYKTSNPSFEAFLSEDHYVQLSSYGVLELARGNVPIAGSIIYAMTGQCVFQRFKKEDFLFIENLISEINSKGNKIEEYPCKINGLCRAGHCDNFQLCKIDSPEVWSHDGKCQKEKREAKGKNTQSAKHTA